MTSAVIHARSDGAGLLANELAADLAAAGVEVLAVAQRHDLLQDIIRLAPDVLVCHEPDPDESLFGTLRALQTQSPRPVLLFTESAEGDRIERAVACGVHAYVVDGYSARRLPPLLKLAQERFKRERALHDALAQVSERLEERKQIDRAKGLLMRARQMHEDEAFTALRSVAMRSGQRIGQVAQGLVEAAQAAADVNRSGQLRMLSQRIVKVQALRCAPQSRQMDSGLLEMSVQRTEAVVQGLARDLPAATFGDLVDPLVQTWTALRSAVQVEPTTGGLPVIDDLAEQMLHQGDALTGAIESAAGAGTLRVVNVCGRQRMLSQRVAKHALLAVLLPAAAAGHRQAAAVARRQFESGVAYLEGLPLVDRDIRAGLAAAATQWQLLLSADPGKPAGRETLVAASEALLELLEGLTAHYERSMQVLGQ
ncbi:MAG TPA: ANTAR domain-containing protein [Rubrivivax sp.]|nr:ANTAR domain-containing protein [Rubrivivax sp.]